MALCHERSVMIYVQHVIMFLLCLQLLQMLLSCARLHGSKLFMMNGEMWLSFMFFVTSYGMYNRSRSIW